MADLKSKSGVEIFSTGKWNGDEYTAQDLDEMVRAFEEVKGAQPHLKLGHDPKQKLLQEDGLPAAGWVGKLYRVGEKLFADFIDIPNKIYQLLENKAYKKVSSEIFFNVEVNGKKYPRMLGAVALLGSNTPGVMNLSDILAMYGLRDYETIKKYAGEKLESKVYSFNNERKFRMEKTALEIKLEQDLAETKTNFTAVDAELKKALEDAKAKETEIEELRQFKVNAEKKAIEDAETKKVQDLKNFVAQLKADKLVTPAMESLVEQFLSEEKKEYKIKDKQYTKTELFKEILKLHSASDVNLEERSEEGQQEGKNKTEALNAEIEKYQTEHKTTYAKAYKAVMSAKK